MCRLSRTFVGLCALLAGSACTPEPAQPPVSVASGSGAGTMAVAAPPETAPSATRIGSTARNIGTLDDIEELSVAIAAERRPSGYFGYGDPATPEQIAGWDIDVRPDGKGLPPGSGTAEQGEALYEEKCSTCHGVFGEGEGRWPKLAGDEPLTGERPEKTVGNYWPYASTLWDYVHRAMPFYEPQSLSDDEVYSVVAYVLYLNELIEYDFELNQSNLAAVEMPNRDGFFVDPRPDVVNAVCMEDCKNPDDIRITWDSTELGVTPTQHFQDDVADAAAPAAVASATLDDAVGQRVYDQACKTCHGPGLAGAPVVGDAPAWAARRDQGLDVLVRHAVEGFQGEAGYMPAKGGQVQLGDEEVAAAVSYMLQNSGAAD